VFKEFFQDTQILGIFFVTSLSTVNLILLLLFLFASMEEVHNPPPPPPPVIPPHFNANDFFIQNGYWN
jgi:hypothetical protein